jgi:lysophospholipase L1-like esterase
VNLLHRTSVSFLALALLSVAALAAPDRWKEEIDKLTAGDATRPPVPGGVVFVGSSSIRLWTTLARDFPNLPVINRGFGGSELADSVFYEDRLVFACHPRTVVLYAGTNDLWAGKTPEAVFADFQAFHAKLRAALPETKLIYLSIVLSPSRVRVHAAMRTANSLIAAECARDPRCTFVDVNTPMAGPDGLPPAGLFRDDRLHLNAVGYAIWTQVLTPYLQP